jgi:hypothetical protein
MDGLARLAAMLGFCPACAAMDMLRLPKDTGAEKCPRPACT